MDTVIILVRGINLVRRGADVVVELWLDDGTYREVIRERADGPISHCVHAAGIVAAVPERCAWQSGASCYPKKLKKSMWDDEEEVA